MNTKVIRTQSDGGSRGNPGPSAAAFWVPSLQFGEGEYISSATNNVAEYAGLILALKWAIKAGYTQLSHRADSKIVVNQVNRSWKVNLPHLEALRDVADVLIAKLESFDIEYVPRAQNAEADRICNEIMDAQENRERSDATAFFR